MPKLSIGARTWANKALLSAAFIALIVSWIVLLAILQAAASSLWLSATLFLLGFLGLLPIGACGYLLRRRLNCAEEVRIEAGRWLAQRLRGGPRERQRRRAAAKRWVLWIPTLLALAAAAFPEQMLDIASYIFHPRSGQLLGYQVSIPRGWMVTMSRPGAGNDV